MGYNTRPVEEGGEKEEEEETFGDRGDWELPPAGPAAVREDDDMTLSRECLKDLPQ